MQGKLLGCLQAKNSHIFIESFIVKFNVLNLHGLNLISSEVC
ncbi:hypothetical protein CCS77_1699 [Campylobacter concisus]|uniref:Uncharacterized protein n=1 Tax=Campylobacter concisus TaxID=199 RepID=A0A2R4P269_9BACT|nr:hypothetical protein CCS77_1699 [Campylobacter concisus]